MSILQSWTDVTAEQAGASVSKRTLVGTGASLVRIEVKAGTQAPRHAHDHEQFVQVISGSGTLNSAEGRRPFAAGDLFHFHANTWHAADFDADTVLVETNVLPVA